MMNLHARVRFLGASFVALAVVASCTQPSTQAGVSPSASGAADTNKTFVYGMPQNAVGGCDGTQIVVTVPVGNCPLLNQEALVRYDESSKTVAPSLATSWTFDGTSATFKLRPSVTFQDGTPFNADAVVFNYRRGSGPPFDANKGGKLPLPAPRPLKCLVNIDDMTTR